MDVGKYIKSLRTNKGLTQEELGKIVGVQKAAVQKWENGTTTNLKRETVQKLADFFDVDVSNFFYETPPEPSNLGAVIPPEQMHMIPVFATVSAGFGAYACSDVVEYIPMIITNPYDVADTIGIRVSGNSMYPKIEDGDTIVVRKQSDVDDGDVAVIMIDSEEGVVKKIQRSANTVTLLSFNPEYAPRIFKGEEMNRLRIVGKVVKVVKDF